MKIRLFSFFMSAVLFAGSIAVPGNKEEQAQILETTALEQFAESIDVSVADSENIYANRRLIVTSDTPEFDVCGAASVVSYNNIYVLSYETETDCENAYAALSSDQAVSGVEVDRMVESAESTEAGDMDFLEAGEGEVNTSLSDYLRNQPTDWEEVKVAVLDSGICTGNAEFEGRLVDLGINFSSSGEAGSIEDDFGHGTTVSSLILEHTYPNVKLMPVKVTNASGKGTVLSLYLGIKAAVQNNADIIQISLTCQDTGASILEDAIQEAADKGIAVVAAAGNYAADAGGYLPANMDGVLAVGSVNSSLERSEFSNYGECIDYVMQGEDITCTGRNDSAEQVSGTSYAAASFTSLLAQLKGADNSRTAGEMCAVLDQYAIDLGETGFDIYYGNGLLSYDAVATDGDGNSQITEDVITELDVNEAEDWENLSDQKLQEYIFYGSDENNARFLSGLSREELTELLKRDTDFNKDVDYDGYDGAYYEYLLEEVKGVAGDKYGENCVDASYTNVDNYFDRRSGYFFVKVTGGGKGTVTTKVKVSFSDKADLSSGQKGSVKWSLDNQTYSAAAGGADGYALKAYNDTGKSSGGVYTSGTALGDNDPDPYVNTSYTYRGMSENDESFSSRHFFVFVSKFSFVIPQHYHIGSVGDSFGSGYAGDIARINSQTYQWDNHRNDPGDYGTHDNANPNLSANGITDYFAMNLGAVALGLKDYTDGKTVHATRTIALAQDASYTLTLDKSTGVKSVSAAAKGVGNVSADTLTIAKSKAADGTGNYKYYAKTDSDTFTSVSLDAVLETGYHWVNWTGYTTKAAQSCTVAMNQDKTFTANAAINTSTLKVDPNGGTWNGSTGVQSFKQNYNTTKVIPVPTRTGYTFAGWKRSAAFHGSMDTLTGKAVYTYGAENKVTDTITAQWTPNVYTVTLDNQLTDLENAATKTTYEKYDTGWFFDKAGTNWIKSSNPIVVPVKTGYKFLGYFTGKTDGDMMVQADGKLVNESATQITSDTIWYAHYEYLIGCEDYADIPCDLEKTDGDIREDIGALVTYDSGNRKVTVTTEQMGCTVYVTAKPVGTTVGQFQSTAMGTSIIGSNSSKQSIEFPLEVPEGAAYQLKVTLNGQTICDRCIYLKNGRFRTMVKLGTQPEKTFVYGATASGSAWGTEVPEYDLYQYRDCSEIKSVSAPGTVYRYFTYKDVNMAYSGNGATSGTNMLEYDVSLENMYQFRENGFAREETQEKQTADNGVYTCDVKYSFEGWNVGGYIYQSQQIDGMIDIYQEAGRKGIIASGTLEPIENYNIFSPLNVVGTVFSLNLIGNQKAALGSGDAIIQNLGAEKHASEYINLEAQWNAFPTIVVTPGDSMEFYEGEEVTKDDLVSHLKANDEEDNDINKHPEYPDSNDKLRIVKIVYPEPENGSQEAYEKEYEEDVPEDFLLDTYYLKLEQDETVDVLVTFAVTDSNGNTTEEEIPVKVKYNNFPEISCEDTYYYLKEEANRGEITAEALIRRATANDVEDGDISEKLELVSFDPQELKMQTKYKEEFPITYQVTDAYRKTTVRTVNVLIWDDVAYNAEQPMFYTRYISEKYLWTLEENSVWREPENMAYLKRVLQNETPMETWYFTHEDVLAVQDWITEDGDGHWKIGQEANQEFRKKFGYCLIEEKENNLKQEE